MARKVYHVVLMILVALLVSAHLGAGAPNSLSSLFPDHISDMIQEDHEFAYYNTQKVREVMQRFMQKQRPHVRLYEIYRKLVDYVTLIMFLIKDTQEVRLNWPTDNFTLNFTVNGMSTTVMSGYTLDGEPYIRDIEEVTYGKYLYHIENDYNLSTNVTKWIRWQMDLTTPDNKFGIHTDEK